MVLSSRKTGCPLGGKDDQRFSFCSHMVLVVKNMHANAGDIRDTGLIPGLGISPGGGHGNPLQYSCLQNPMDSRAWWATVHSVVKSQALLKWLSTHARRGKSSQEWIKSLLLIEQIRKLGFLITAHWPFISWFPGCCVCFATDLSVPF